MNATLDDENPGQSEGQVDPTNLIVNYLPPSVGQDELRRMFEPYGKIERCKILVDRKDGHSLGFGFVKFATQEEAREAIERMNGYRLLTKTIKVGIARPSTGEIYCSNLYVTYLEPHITEDDILKSFGAFGSIIEIRMLRDPATQKCRGVAFVRFAVQSEATNAMSTLNGALGPNNEQKLSIRYADSGERRKTSWRTQRTPQQPIIRTRTDMHKTYPYSVDALSAPLRSMSLSESDMMYKQQSHRPSSMGGYPRYPPSIPNMMPQFEMMDPRYMHAYAAAMSAYYTQMQPTDKRRMSSQSDMQPQQAQQYYMS